MIASADSPVLVADVGGTNLNLALLAPEGGRFRLLRKARFSTQEERSLLDPVRSFLDANATVRPRQACFPGAGPVLDRRIHLTNAPWDIDGPALERDLHMPVHLVNDFIALSCGVVQLDLTDPSQATPLPHGDGSLVDQPAAISAQAPTDAACARAMALFVDLYARVCADSLRCLHPHGRSVPGGRHRVEERAAFPKRPLHGPLRAERPRPPGPARPLHTCIPGARLRPEPLRRGPRPGLRALS